MKPTPALDAELSFYAARAQAEVAFFKVLRESQALGVVDYTRALADALAAAAVVFDAAASAAFAAYYRVEGW